MTSSSVNSQGYTHCDLLRGPTLIGQRGSALIFTITVVSLAILFLSHLEPGFFPKHAALLGTLGGVLTGTFAIFVITSLVRQKDERNTKKTSEKTAVLDLLKEREKNPPPLPQGPNPFPARENSKVRPKKPSKKKSSLETQPPEEASKQPVGEKVKKKMHKTQPAKPAQEPLPPAESAEKTHEDTKGALTQKKVKKKASSPPPSDTSSHGSSAEEDELPLDHMMRVLVMPLFNSFEELAKAMVLCHGVKTNTLKNLEDLKKKEDEVHQLVEDLKAFVIKLLNKKTLFVTELLAAFGPPKQSEHFFFRLLVTAHNSGDSQIFESTQRTYLASKNGRDLSDVHHWLNEQKLKPEEALSNFPTILGPHFSFDISDYKEQGIEILNDIFKKAKNNTTAQKKFLELQKRPYDKDFPNHVKIFVRTVFKEADIKSDQLDRWNQTLISNTFKFRLKFAVPFLLKAITQNLRILELMIDKKKPNEEFFPELDLIAQTAESNHLFTSTKQELQKALIGLQGKFNCTKKPQERIALIAIPRGEKEDDYSELAKRYPIVAYALGDYPRKHSDLKKINDDKEVKNLGKHHNVRVIAIPVFISDHPFKTIRTKEKSVPSVIIRYGAQLVGLLRPVILKLVQPKLKEIVPDLDQKEQKQLDEIVQRVISLLLHPIVDGSISMHKEFSPIFKKAFVTEGKKLAIEVESLISSESLPSFEQICDVWVKGAASITKVFMDAATNQA